MIIDTEAMTIGAFRALYPGAEWERHPDQDGGLVLGKTSLRKAIAGAVATLPVGEPLERGVGSERWGHTEP